MFNIKDSIMVKTNFLQLKSLAIKKFSGVFHIT